MSESSFRRSRRRHVSCITIVHIFIVQYLSCASALFITADPPFLKDPQNITIQSISDHNSLLDYDGNEFYLDSLKPFTELFSPDTFIVVNHEHNVIHKPTRTVMNVSVYRGQLDDGSVLLMSKTTANDKIDYILLSRTGSSTTHFIPSQEQPGAFLTISKEDYDFQMISEHNVFEDKRKRPHTLHPPTTVSKKAKSNKNQFQNAVEEIERKRRHGSHPFRTKNRKMRGDRSRMRRQRYLQETSNFINGDGSSQECTAFYVIPVTIFFDVEFCQLYNSEYNSAVANIQMIVAAASLYYENNLCGKIKLMGVYSDTTTCNPADSPFQAFDRSVCGSYLDAFTAYMEAEKDGLGIDYTSYVHLFTGLRSGLNLGCSWEPGPCGSEFVYGVESMSFLFPDIAGPAFILAHELGHNLGASHDFTSNDPPNYIMEANFNDGSDGFSPESLAIISNTLKDPLNFCITLEPVTQPPIVMSQSPSLPPIKASEAPTETLTIPPSIEPTPMPTTSQPTRTPTIPATPLPTTLPPTVSPSASPTPLPTTVSPTSPPSRSPTPVPTSLSPTTPPSTKPSVTPTILPTVIPSPLPTTRSPTAPPSSSPTPLSTSSSPTAPPTIAPTLFPTTLIPSSSPFIAPTPTTTTRSPTSSPGFPPTPMTTTLSPSVPPNLETTRVPTSASPTAPPSLEATEPVPISAKPTSAPSVALTATPTSSLPTDLETRRPTTQRPPSLRPTSRTTLPTTHEPTPTSQPTANIPTIMPAKATTKVPSDRPTITPTTTPECIYETLFVDPICIHASTFERNEYVCFDKEQLLVFSPTSLDCQSYADIRLKECTDQYLPYPGSFVLSNKMSPTRNHYFDGNANDTVTWNTTRNATTSMKNNHDNNDDNVIQLNSLLDSEQFILQQQSRQYRNMPSSTSTTTVDWNHQFPLCNNICSEVNGRICLSSTTQPGYDRWFRIQYSVQDSRITTPTAAGTNEIDMTIFVVMKENGQRECVQGGYVKCITIGS